MGTLELMSIFYELCFASRDGFNRTQNNIFKTKLFSL